MNTKYCHLVEVDADKRMLVIHRVYSDARKELFTQVEVPTGEAVLDKRKVDEFCRMLGENLLIDSPSARELLRL